MNLAEVHRATIQSGVCPDPLSVRLRGNGPFARIRIRTHLDRSGLHQLEPATLSTRGRASGDASSQHRLPEP